jgi:hypothetical protein
MQAYPGNIGGLLTAATNTSTSSLFHAWKAYDAKVELNSLTTVLLKLDREQPHPSGSTRISAFQEHIHELSQKQSYAEYWANHHYYRDVIMRNIEAASDNISDVSSVASSVTSIVSSLT